MADSNMVTDKNIAEQLRNNNIISDELVAELPPKAVYHPRSDIMLILDAVKQLDQRMLIFASILQEEGIVSLSASDIDDMQEVMLSQQNVIVELVGFASKLPDPHKSQFHSLVQSLDDWTKLENARTRLDVRREQRKSIMNSLDLNDDNYQVEEDDE